ncbi:hypothetical protein C9J47_22300 [Photobacterium indicum]|uniref:Uncharacterized protein n=1 Tax=Photobacterium indicum TaxID=81447 RepID=A0A2T3L3C0_9GAMM|nr:hypothetical protein C9J47_22300 [Photobacterium indicum]
MEIVTWEEAVVKGLKRYYTGVPCKHGHLSERYRISRICLECSIVTREKSKERGGVIKRECALVIPELYGSKYRKAKEISDLYLGVILRNVTKAKITICPITINKVSYNPPMGQPREITLENAEHLARVRDEWVRGLLVELELDKTARRMNFPEVGEVDTKGRLRVE